MRESEFFTRWDKVTEDDCVALRLALSEARNERAMQTFLEEHPHLLVQHMSHGHGRWVIPQKRLGSEYVTDFVIGGRDSMGYHWTAVELESPLARPFTRGGNDSAELNHARRQIEDWKNWLRSNIDYANRPVEKQGLGLPEISDGVAALIIIGRRADMTGPANQRRRIWKEQYGIDVHSYEWLVDEAVQRVKALARWRATPDRALE